MFLFVDEAYGLEDYIPIMYSELVEQFDNKVGIKKYFEDQGFGLIINSDKGIYKNQDYEAYSFLDTYLVFPPDALLIYVLFAGGLTIEGYQTSFGPQIFLNLN